MPPRQHADSTSSRGYGAQWQRVRLDQLRRSPWCAVCGSRGTSDNPLTVDHIVRLRQGGDSSPANLQTLCRACHGRKDGAGR